MATVMESLAVVPRSSALPNPTDSLVTASSVSSFSGHGRSVGALPEFKGLRIRPIRSLGSVSLSSGSRLGRGGRIVCEARETTVEVSGITDANWKSCVLDCDTPVLVEFWAPWCGPCRMIHPVIDELAKQYVGKLKCYKVNTDECPSIATQYGIRSIPTVIIFKDGEKKDAIIGAVPKSTLTSSIDKFL